MTDTQIPEVIHSAIADFARSVREAGDAGIPAGALSLLNFVISMQLDSRHKEGLVIGHDVGYEEAMRDLRDRD